MNTKALKASILRAIQECDNPLNSPARRSAAGVFVLSQRHRLQIAEADNRWLRELGIQPDADDPDAPITLADGLRVFICELEQTSSTTKRWLKLWSQRN